MSFNIEHLNPSFNKPKPHESKEKLKSGVEEVVNNGLEEDSGAGSGGYMKVNRKEEEDKKKKKKKPTGRTPLDTTKMEDPETQISNFIHEVSSGSEYSLSKIRLEKILRGQ